MPEENETTENSLDDSKKISESISKKELQDWIDKDASKFMEDDREFKLRDGTIIKGSQIKKHLD